MELDIKEAKQAVDEGKQIWFFINKFTDLTENLYVNIPPAKVAEIINYKDRSHESELVPLGKRGEPLSKKYTITETSRSSVRCFARFFSDKNACFDAYNADLDSYVSKMEDKMAYENKRRLSVIEKIKGRKIK
ncbi:hypothetical protein ACXHQ0_16630 [Vibrio antiquarius]|uniref:Uncharacterized protein n=1 Tax=Vibrio parahaemolyticus TaxID=670 RepID=A0AA46Z4Q4_VIBPH|nr:MULTISPECIES: hypothetical protein [Vibrio harveyi group]KOE96240.1 hypothetical protein ACS91_00330 [Vibrio parahaemolyticus]KOY41195.1 hypothetical protein ACX10_02495 [Vibrio parahaemolyticus]MCS0117247.1 hypothetical protein [Vibrio parahaemolyticus]MCS0310803.1 hypothetical protein [Vibrio diabolicus]UYV29921.1 hypothetical protein M5598_28465 [Vibrio parahaemolyticus]